MLDKISFKQILFLDIETVPQEVDFNSVTDKMKDFWEKKSSYFRENDSNAEDVYQRAGIYAEFGKIVCISVGAINGEKPYSFKLKSFYGNNEKEILNSFSDFCTRLEKDRQVYLCAHNGKEFDYPYIARRMLIQGVQLPGILDIAGKKPWEVNHLDTLELWKFGDYKHYTSLDLLTHIFNIPSPKQDIDGSMVSHVYYIEKNLEKIKRYCERDVLAVAQLIMRYTNRPLIKEENISILE
jgi:DNA polymerase elongation subunit (family B)